VFHTGLRCALVRRVRFVRLLRIGAVTLAIAVPLGSAAPPARAETGAPFVVEPGPFAMGQAPDWKPDGTGFVFARVGPDGKNQVHVADRDGSNVRCLTCGRPGPNQVAHYRPQGDVILFHSWGDHRFQLGGPGYGGIGSDVFVMKADGSDVVNLTQGQEGEDNYHAYWSPDGSQILWTHVAGDIQNGNLGDFDIRVADYVVDTTGPHLANLRVVHGPVPHFIETQWWAPDNGGFLYTETVGNALNPELFLFRFGAGPGGQPTIHQLTHDPAWDEQAVFEPGAPDKVIFMSTRGDRVTTWSSWAALSAAARLPNNADQLLILPVFAATFFSPVVPPTTDLYEVDISTPALVTRRLTHEGHDGWIIPEFAWDPSGTTLLWTEQKNRDSVRVSHVDDPGRDVGELAGLPSEPLPTTIGLGSFLVARTVEGHFASNTP